TFLIPLHSWLNLDPNPAMAYSHRRNPHCRAHYYRAGPLIDYHPGVSIRLNGKFFNLGNKSYHIAAESQRNCQFDGGLVNGSGRLTTVYLVDRAFETSRSGEIRFVEDY